MCLEKETLSQHLPLAWGVQETGDKEECFSLVTYRQPLLGTLLKTHPEATQEVHSLY